MQRRFNHGLGFQWFYVMSNAMWVGSGGEFPAQTGAQLPDPVTFLPGSVPCNFDAYNRFYNYSRDPNIPKHRVNWNMLYDLPFGQGKKWLSNSGGLLNRIVGGWQLAAYSTMNSRYITLPTTNWGPFGKVRSTESNIRCRIAAAARASGAISGTTATYRRTRSTPITRRASARAYAACRRITSRPTSRFGRYRPTPARRIRTIALYGTNIVYVPLKNGTQQLVAYDNGLNPWRNQYIPGPWAWTVNSSLFKVIPLNERLKLRLNMDFFNVFNMPGTPMPNASTGIISLQNSNNAPRQLQWTLRLTW